MMKICYDHRQKARNGRLRDFASKMSPFLNRFLADVRLTHFHRSGTWLAPTDISQTFFPLFSFIHHWRVGGSAVGRPANDDTLLEKRGYILYLLKQKLIRKRTLGGLGGSTFGRAHEGGENYVFALIVNRELCIVN
jgi:hypothetical protein